MTSPPRTGHTVFLLWAKEVVERKNPVATLVNIQLHSVECNTPRISASRVIPALWLARTHVNEAIVLFATFVDKFGAWEHEMHCGDNEVADEDGRIGAAQRASMLLFVYSVSLRNNPPPSPFSRDTIRVQ